MAGEDETADGRAETRLQAFLLGQQSDERRHRRVVISLPVRFMAGDGTEHRGLLFDMSPGGLSVTADHQPPIGSQTIVYIDDIGRVEGQVARHHSYGFAIRLASTQHRRDKIAERLTFHANRHRLRDEDLRGHERSELNQSVRCIMPDGQEVPCRVIDLSLTGAAIAMTHPLPLGSELMIGRMQGRVVRKLPDGVAVRFLTVMNSAATIRDRLVRP